MSVVRQILRLSILAGFSITLAFVLAANTHNTLAMADQETGRPEQTILVVAPDENEEEPALRSIGNTYLSPVMEANQPFTHMLLRWEAQAPVTNTITIEVRVSVDNQSWSDWGPVLEDPDLWVPQDGDQVYWSQVIHAGDDARFWQIRAVLHLLPDGTLPDLRRIEVNTVDARFGPADADRDTETDVPVDPPPDPADPDRDTDTDTGVPIDTRLDLADPDQNTDTEASLSNVAELAQVGKPSVISRTAWGNPDGQGSRVRPVYYPVSHMVVHHTADANSLRGSEQRWSDRVRAIWSFHTFTRGWGDVGYNFLIDPNGVIYEGRSGGDDAVAFHDTGNYGSMGVVVIGTYTNVAPSPASQDSLVTLLAWKAAQKGIDPLGRSYYYGCDISQYCRPYNRGAVVANIAGHRHVTPVHTTCPGDQFVNLLPAIRNRVQNRIQAGGFIPGQPDNGDLLIDELEDTFARSQANWYSASCGYGGHTFYTYATDNPQESTNRATWRPTIPASGRYRIFAHIPQGCGLGTAPYATRQATYRIHSAAGDFQRVVDHNTAEEWVDLGVYEFRQGTAGAVELDDLTGEPFSQRRVIFFDSVKWVPEQNTASAELLNVAYERTTIAVGEVLKVTFTVRNAGDVPIHGQIPQAGTFPDGTFNVPNGYVYDEGECFLGATGQDYPIYAKETDRFRILLGATDRTLACDGDTGGYPWRWGLNGTLEPGEERDIVGYVRFRQPGSVTLQAGIIQEYVGYHVQNAAIQTITITPETMAPVAISYDAQFQPLAHVYTLGAIPDNLLARTRNPLSITRGEYVGSFAWDGSTLDWGDGGPLGLADNFVVEQTRLFFAPHAGEYVFRTTSDDGSWLWVNGESVVVNHGLHSTTDVTGTMTLEAGLHVLSFKYFERTGLATAGYAVQLPGSSTFMTPPPGIVDDTPRIGSIFTGTPDLTLAADDLGGSGVALLRYSWDGQTWIENPGQMLRLGRLVDGRYHLRYQAVDQAGNESPIYELQFSVNSNASLFQVYLPLVQGS